MNIRTRGVQAVSKIGEIWGKGKGKGEHIYPGKRLNILNIVDSEAFKA